MSLTPQALQAVLKAANQIILGKTAQTKLALTCLLAGGHLLIEDMPGLGKTTLAHTMARLLGLKISRIQFTSDLLPADITGISVFERHPDTQQGHFRFMPGPIFSQLLLADEINRATPKTQSALLEAMEEEQVTVDGKTHRLPRPFFVIATQNPTHHIGTFPLPESQIDRFLIRIRLGYPDRAAEHQLLSGSNPRKQADSVTPLLEASQLPAIQAAVATVHAASPLIAYIQNLLEATRLSAAVVHGLSPRAGMSLLAAARAFAWLDGRAIVLPDDVQAVFPAVACHRLRSSEGGHDMREEEAEALLRQVAIP